MGIFFSGFYLFSFLCVFYILKASFFRLRYIFFYAFFLFFFPFPLFIGIFIESKIFLIFSAWIFLLLSSFLSLPSFFPLSSFLPYFVPSFLYFLLPFFLIPFFFFLNISFDWAIHFSSSMSSRCNSLFNFIQ